MIKTIKWFVAEYRHEDREGKYYLTNIVRIWFYGVKIGFLMGLLPAILVWVLK